MACNILQGNLYWKLEIGNGSFSVTEIGNILMVEGLTEQPDVGIGKQQERIVTWYAILGQLEWKRPWFSMLAELLVVSGLIGLCMNIPWMKRSLRDAWVLRYHLIGHFLLQISLFSYSFWSWEEYYLLTFGFWYKFIFRTIMHFTRFTRKVDLVQKMVNNMAHHLMKNSGQMMT